MQLLTCEQWAEVFDLGIRPVQGADMTVDDLTRILMRLNQ